MQKAESSVLEVSLQEYPLLALVVSSTPRETVHGLLPHSMGRAVSTCETQAIEQRNVHDVVLVGGST